MMKRAINILLTISFVAAGVALCSLMLGHFDHIATTVENIDDEAKIVQDMRQHFPQAKNIAFATNLSEDEYSQAAYYYTQFVWCPDILSSQVADHDTVLIYHQYGGRDSIPSELTVIDTLYQRPGMGYELLLVQKRKSD